MIVSKIQVTGSNPEEPPGVFLVGFYTDADYARMYCEMQTPGHPAWVVDEKTGVRSLGNYTITPVLVEENFDMSEYAAYRLQEARQVLESMDPGDIRLLLEEGVLNETSRAVLEMCNHGA